MLCIIIESIGNQDVSQSLLWIKYHKIVASNLFMVNIVIDTRENVIYIKKGKPENSKANFIVFGSALPHNVDDAIITCSSLHCLFLLLPAIKLRNHNIIEYFLYGFIIFGLNLGNLILDKHYR